MKTKYRFLVLTALLFGLATPSCWAGTNWLEQCHGMPVFSGWKVEPNVYGSANIAYEFGSHCTTPETKLFGHDDYVIGVKGTWSPGTKQAFEYITVTDYAIYSNGSQHTSTRVTSLVYKCQAGDPWANRYGNECKLTYCTATLKADCGITSKYSAYPITYNGVPDNARLAVRNALLGPVVVTAPTSNQLITPNSTAGGKLHVELRGPATAPPNKVGLSFEYYNAGANDWEGYFPAVGEKLHMPYVANEVSVPHANGIAANYETPLTYDTFKVTPTKTITGKWRVRACAKGTENQLCSRWAVFNVENVAFRRIQPRINRRIMVRPIKLKPASK